MSQQHGGATTLRNNNSTYSNLTNRNLYSNSNHPSSSSKQTAFSGIGKGGMPSQTTKQEQLQATTKQENGSVGVQERVDIQESSINMKQSNNGSAQRSSIQNSGTKNRMKAKTTYNQHSSQISSNTPGLPKLQINGLSGTQQQQSQLTGRESINAKKNFNQQPENEIEDFQLSQKPTVPIHESVIQEVPTTETNQEERKSGVEEFKGKSQNEQPFGRRIGGGIMSVDKKEGSKVSSLQISRIPSSQKQQVSSTFHSPRLATKIKFNNQASNSSSSTVANNMSMQISQTYQNAVPQTKIGHFSLASPQANEKQHSLTIDQRYSQNDSSQNADSQQNQDLSIISHTAHQNPYNVGKINNFSLGSIMTTKDLKPSQQTSSATQNTSSNSTNPFNQSHNKPYSKQHTSSSTQPSSTQQNQTQKLYQNSVVKGSKLNSADRERNSNLKNSEYMVKGTANMNVGNQNQAPNKISGGIHSDIHAKSGGVNNHHSSHQLATYQQPNSGQQQSSQNFANSQSLMIGGLGGISPSLSKSQVHQGVKNPSTGTSQITKLNLVHNDQCNSDANSVASGTIQDKTPSYRERQRVAQTRETLNAVTNGAAKSTKVKDTNPFKVNNLSQKEKIPIPPQDRTQKEMIFVSEAISKVDLENSEGKKNQSSPSNFKASGQGKNNEELIELQVKQQLSKQSSKIMQRKSNQQSEIDDDDLMDEALNDSLELKECMSFTTAGEFNQVKLNQQQSSSAYSSALKKKLTLQPQESNSSKLQASNTQTPNRAAGKAPNLYQNSNSSNKHSSSAAHQNGSTSHRPSTLGLGPKQQTIKQSVVQGKKTLASLADTQKEQTIKLEKQQIKEAAVNSSLDGSLDNSSSNQIKPQKSALELNLSLSNLTMLPIQQISNQQLKTLDLRNNKLTKESLVTELFKLPNLWKLQLDNNQIEELPDYFQSLACLRQFTVAQNQLKSLPSSIFKIKKLEKLDISQNKISQLSSQIGLLEQMKYLYFHNNHLCELPTSIGSLKHIQQLSSEWFQYIPRFLDKLIKRNIPPVSLPGYSALEDESLLFQIQTALRRSHTVEYIDFPSFLINLFQLKGPLQLFNDFLIVGQSNLFHKVIRNQHQHLFDSIMDRHFDIIDINAEDENQLTALVIALQENNSSMVDGILKRFGEQIDLVNPPTSSSAFKQSLLSQQSQSSMPETDSKVYVHPLLLAYRNLLYDTAKKILKLMVRAHNKQLQSFLISSSASHSSASSALSRQQQLQNHLSQSKERMVLDLNMKDEYNNTIFHYVFANFSANMALSVEHCQELLKILEDGNRTSPPTVTLSLNEVNKQGMTPFDLAIESKSNFAVEFALYYNKNLLPAFQNVRSKLTNKETFDVNFHKNHLGITPLHRAVLTRNHKAIYLLLDSGLCNTFNVDKEFKTARDLCLKQRYLYQYLKKGELNQIRTFIGKVFKEIREEQRSLSLDNSQKNLSINGAIQSTGQDYQKTYSSINGGVNTLSNFQPKKGGFTKKGLQHTNINFFQMSQGRGNRIKYNSWYTGLSGPQGRGFLGGLKDQNGNSSSSRQNTDQDNTMKMSDLLTSQQINQKKGNKPSNEDSSSSSLNRRRNSSSQQSNLDNQIRIEDVDDDEEEVNLLKSSQQHQVQQSITGGKAITSKKSIIDQDREREKSQGRQISLLKASIIEGTQQSSNQGAQPLLQISNVKSQGNHDKSKRLSQGSEKLSKAAQALKLKETQPKQSSDKIKQTAAAIKSKTAAYPKTQTSLGKTVASKAQINSKQYKRIGILSPNQVTDEVVSKSENILEEESQFEEFDLGNDNVDDEHGDQYFESPTTTLPSRKYKHVMAVNNSKLSRKPYFKQIQQNRFEREFCMIMDSKLTWEQRLKLLYQTFTEVFKKINSPDKEEVLNFYKDGRELLGFLKLELENKEFALQPLRHEILYFQEMLLNFQSSYLDQEMLQPSALLMISGNTSRGQRQNNNNFSLERGPLPIIQETQVESNNISPVKKQQTSSKDQIAVHTKAETSRKLLQHPQASILSQHFSSQDLDSRESGSLQGSQIKRMPNTRHTNSTKNLELQANGNQQYQQVQIPQLQLSMHSTIIVQNTSKQGSLASLGYESPKRMRMTSQTQGVNNNLLHQNQRDNESMGSAERDKLSQREAQQKSLGSTAQNDQAKTAPSLTQITKNNLSAQTQMYQSPQSTRMIKNPKVAQAAINNQSNLKMPSPSSSQTQIKDSISRGKDLYVKKIQVQITNTQASQQMQNQNQSSHSLERQNLQNTNTLTQKWKQLSIDPSGSNSSNLKTQNPRKDSSEINSESQVSNNLLSKLPATPKTQKISTTTNQQKSLAMTSSQIKNQRQSTLQQNQSASIAKGQTFSTIQGLSNSHQKVNEIQQTQVGNSSANQNLIVSKQGAVNSTSMSHRSTSNPRNSLLGVSATSGMSSGIKAPSKLQITQSQNADINLNSQQNTQFSNTLNSSSLSKNLLSANKQSNTNAQIQKLGNSGASSSKPLNQQTLTYSASKFGKR